MNWYLKIYIWHFWSFYIGLQFSIFYIRILSEIFKCALFFYKFNLNETIHGLLTDLYLINHLTNYSASIVHQIEAIYELFKEFKIFLKFSIYGLYGIYTVLSILVLILLSYIIENCLVLEF